MLFFSRQQYIDPEVFFNLFARFGQSTAHPDLQARKLSAVWWPSHCVWCWRTTLFYRGVLVAYRVVWCVMLESNGIFWCVAFRVTPLCECTALLYDAAMLGQALRRTLSFLLFIYLVRIFSLHILVPARLTSPNPYHIPWCDTTVLPTLA